ncbi:uncharacterized protein ACA1_024390 [Acanthamoeba castellanii str. Neff]|uniref:BAR domain-containing protein n=1 Tax=Acanthamoeba castellanii (strain ATCC 30010 / Neff) TaxID=1257118 RepID=L8H927_ACACF|nr:uncharacterized protein ACA1_024390 [Acanthamoeba castellanii str. Neff]ELR21238.1 hypothetical protein ACA1_024390 [Acanthamoeba castellanii str. Neff]
MEGGNGKDNQEEFELARANFEKTSSVLEKLIKSIAKISDSFKVSMWAVIDLSEVMKEFLGAGPSIELEDSMNEYMKEVADQVNSMNVFYEQHKAFRDPIHPPHTHNTQTKIEHREKLNQQNKTASNANGVKTRAALDEFDKQLKDDLVSHHYSRYRRVAPELHKYVQTQMKLFSRMNESLSGMSEFLAKKCRAHPYCPTYRTVGRNSLKKSSRRDKSLGNSGGAVPTTSLSSSRSATSHSPPTPSSPVPPPRVRPGTVSARDPPPVPPKNRSATTASRSHIGGKTATVPSSLAKIYRRSVSQQNLVNKKLSELGDDEPDKEERSHSVDDGEKIGDLRSMLVDSGVSSLSSSEKKVTIPAPSYPRPQGVAPPPSRPVSTQVTKEDVEAERKKDPTKFRRQPPPPGGPRGPPTSGPFGLPSSPSLSSSLISSVAIPSLSGTASAQSSEEHGGGSPPVSASPPPIPSALNKPKNTLSHALASSADSDWALQPRKAKGTTGVQPTVVAERRQYWKSLDGRPTL